MTVEILARITGPHFVAGLVLHDDKVVQTAPILRRMRGWSRDRVRAECKRIGWSISVVRQIESADIVTPAPPPPGITQHSEGFEVVRSDGTIEFVYFDDNPGRRAINNRLTKEAAFARAQELLSKSL